MPDVNFGWLTTAPHPTRQYSWDRGQRGWRLHTVLLPEGELLKDGRGLVALCGLSPRRGWGLDLFIDDECARCHAAMTTRQAGGDVFIDLPAKQAAAREAARLAAEEAEYQRELLEPFKGAKQRSHIDLAQGDLLAPPAAPRERRLTTRQLCDIQEATDAASCAAAATRKASPYCSLSFGWNGSGHHGYVRDDALGWITFAMWA